MFRSIGYHPVPTDPFNFLRNRNVRNTEKRTYNCGGYALGTFSWYCPHRREDDFTPFGAYYADTASEAESITQHSVQVMLEDFRGKLRVISDVAEANMRNEIVIAFRISTKSGDFHYVRRGCNGGWYHKMGARPYIDKMDAVEVFSDYWLCGCIRYDGPLVLFALTK